MASPVGNFSYAWAGAVANDAAAGTIAWTNPNNASGLPDGTYATCALGAGESSQYAKATTFTFYPAIPSTATILGFALITKGKDTVAANLAVNTEVKLIKGGAISGSNLADGQPFSSSITNSSQNPMPMIGKSGTELGGLSWTAADISADTNFGIAWRWSTTGALTLSLDAVGIIVYWTDTTAAVATATTPTTRLVGEVIGAQAIDSVIGSNRWERSRVRWELVTYPSGFTCTTSDPRRGNDVNAVSRDWKTDVRGRVYAVQATHAGTYTLKCYIDCEDGTTLVSNTLTYTVSARSASTYHVKPSTGNNGNTGLSEAQAWQTFAYAVANAPTGAKVLLYDDETFAPGASTPTIATDNLHFIRSGTGAAKPVFEISTAQSVATLTGDDLIFEDIDFGDNTTRLALVAKPYIFTASNCKRLVITGCEGTHWLSCVEISSSTSNEAFLLCNNPDLGGFSRYFLYAGGSDCRYMVVAGNVSSGNSVTAGEGWCRVSASVANGNGVGANVFWNDVQSTRPSGTVSYTAANPTVCTDVGHGLLTGNSVTFAGSTGTSINGARTVTVVDADTFTVPVNVATPGTATYTTLPQVFVRPGWSHVDVWGNRVRDLYFNIAEAESSTNASFCLCNRFIANDITPSSVGIAGVNQRGAIAPLFASNLVYEAAPLVNTDWNDGDAYWYCYINNTIINSASASGIGIADLAGEGWTPWGLEYKNNLHVVYDAWSSFYHSDVASPSWIDATREVAFANNVYKRNGTAAQVRFKVANANKLLAEWNAYDAVAAEEYELTLVPADVTATTNWLPSSSFTVARTNAVPIDGIFDDYVGSNRDMEAATWSAGATGGDPIAAPTLVYQASEVGTAHATQATFGWTAVAGVTNYRLKYGTTSGIYTLNAEAAAVTVDLSGLTPSTTYYGVVVSVEDGVESDPTTEFYWTTGPQGAPQTDGTRIYGTLGTNVPVGGFTDWTSPGNCNGNAANDASPATLALASAASGDSLGLTIPATDIEGVMVGVKIGVRIGATVGPHASALFTIGALSGNDWYLKMNASEYDDLDAATITDREYTCTLSYGTWAAVQADIEAGLALSANHGILIGGGSSGGNTTFAVVEAWLLPVLASPSGGTAGEGRGSLARRLLLER